MKFPQKCGKIQCGTLKTKLKNGGIEQLLEDQVEPLILVAK
jgi:hypothetical protein